MTIGMLVIQQQHVKVTFDYGNQQKLF